jgi:type 1 glutamine amidotransferase
MKILVIADDYWHPARTPRAGLAPLAGDEFTFAWIEDSANWSPQQMAAHDVVLLTKSNNVSSADRTPWMTDEVQRSFETYVRGGGGLLGVHSGTADYLEAATLRRLLGGVFTHHPKQCLVTVTPQAGHPLAGCPPFTAPDEHYFMEMDDPAVEIFMTTTSEHGTQPGGWTRSEGDGRVCVLTPGHNVEVWLEPSFQTLLANSLRWCGKKE